MPFTFTGGGSFSITSIFAGSTSSPFEDTLWPRTIPSVTMKVHFSQLRTKFVSIHLSITTSRFFKHKSNDDPYTEKSSMNTSMLFSIKSEKIACMHLLNVARALHSPNGILRYAKMPKGHVKAVF